MKRFLSALCAILCLATASAQSDSTEPRVQAVFVSWAPGAVAPTATQYVHLSGSGGTGVTYQSWTNSDLQKAIPMPTGGVLRKLYVQRYATAQPATGDLVISVRINGAATALSVTIPAGAATNTPFVNLDDAIEVKPGDRVCFQATNSATGPSMQLQSISVVLTDK